MARERMDRQVGRKDIRQDSGRVAHVRREGRQLMAEEMVEETVAQREGKVLIPAHQSREILPFDVVACVEPKKGLLEFRDFRHRWAHVPKLRGRFAGDLVVGPGCCSEAPRRHCCVLSACV